MKGPYGARRTPIALIILVSALLNVNAQALPDLSNQAYVSPVSDDRGIKKSYPTTSADDVQSFTDWLVVEGTGNCCENYLAATATGTLLDFGGTYLNVSKDGGHSWQSVRPGSLPLLGGEGAVAVAPGGDIVGVGWDTYGGDHLRSFKYSSSTDQWRYAETPIHAPFFDRPWIAAIPGPFLVDGHSVPYISVVKGGWPSKENILYSFDGLNYYDMSIDPIESLLGAPDYSSIEPLAYSDADWIQPITHAGIIALGSGEALSSSLAYPALCNAKRLQADLSWACGTEVGFQNVQADSRGRLHRVSDVFNGIKYEISTDGAQTWQSITVRLPSGYEALKGFDFKANAALGIAAVAIPAFNQELGVDQHLVVKLDISGDTARFVRRYNVGDPDHASGSGIDYSFRCLLEPTNPECDSARFDFPSIVILPSGKIAVSFADQDHLEPSIAVEQ